MILTSKFPIKLVLIKHNAAGEAGNAHDTNANDEAEKDNGKTLRLTGTMMVTCI